MQKAAQDSHKGFIRAPLGEKFDRLEKDYAIMCELEDSITSFGYVLQILTNQKGIVRKTQLNKRGKLIIELKSVDPKEVKPESSSLSQKLVDVRKVYQEGESVFFSDVELQLIFVTVASFADSLFKSVAEYARFVQRNA